MFARLPLSVVTPTLDFTGLIRVSYIHQLYGFTATKTKA